MTRALLLLFCCLVWLPMPAQARLASSPAEVRGSDLPLRDLAEVRKSGELRVLVNQSRNSSGEVKGQAIGVERHRLRAFEQYLNSRSPSARNLTLKLIPKPKDQLLAALQRGEGDLVAPGELLPAHDGLWQAAGETAHDVAARLAVVPMVLEARGLDVTPATLERVAAAGDAHGAKILTRILDDEIRHVAFGTKHFLRCAETQQQAPESLWQNLVKRHFKGAVKPPFNDSARLAAGLSRGFYAEIAH